MKETYVYWLVVIRPSGKQGHIVADALLPTQNNVSPFACAHNICCGHKFCVQATKNVSDFVPSLHSMETRFHEQQCVHNDVSSFAGAYSKGVD